MSHKTEAVRLDQLSSIQPDADSANSIALSALVSATLALVEAQEAANEQARIANLIALVGMEFPDGRTHYPQLVAQLVGDSASIIRPEIARALGIEVAE